ncbi:MAG TPA: YciI family protein [Candidatus Elarobacter sp.]|nr:YciI family protein [Candidatus Elarobacter sp.]
MVIVKATPETEAGVLPTTEELTAMGRFNEELVKAGMMLAGDGLKPSSKGARIRYSAGKPTVTDGPFTEAKELVAGFWLIQAKSKDEVVEWLKRAPFEDAEVEIRPLYEAEDFGESLTPELRDAEEKLRAQAASNR